MLRLAIRVARDQAEIVLAELLELAPSGVEEVELDGGLVEYAVYGPPGELPALPDVRAAVGGALVSVSTTELADDWSQRWREFHRPLVLGERLTVRPPWEPRGSTPLDLVIDPGQAFGTGAHATTRLCLEALLELPPGDTLLDLGCGSGVLAIAAVKLGWRRVLAVDFDPAALAATADNAARNAAAVDVGRLDLRHEDAPYADTVAANLLGPLLVAWAGRLAGVDADSRPGRVIASGLLVTEAGRVTKAFGRAGFTVRSRSELGEWGALVLERRTSAFASTPRVRERHR